MTDTWGLVQFFPSNGLDRSLHAPVFIGLLLLSFFKETLGWTYAGLVVPGYLATVFLAAPVTGVLVVVESVLTYVMSAILGRVLPRTGVWFTFFGRERFLLIIAVASFVRLLLEAAVVPGLVRSLGLTHSRELYSLGLVLVPLLANSYWNAGLVRAFPRMVVVTGLTYLVVSQVLLRFTNFTISRFQVANESVSLAFLESPHAHIILLIGAVLGARNNVRYGWDYNGILVPALLAVAWYQPSKVLATVVEALVVYYLSVAVLRLPPLSRLLVVGSRRLVVTFSVGFLLKFATGEALLRLAPQVQLVDTFGFGYLLPSLLAVKFWDKGKVLRVLMPTLQVSMIAFPLGLAAGYTLKLLSPPPADAAAGVRSPAPAQRLELALMQGDSAPAPHRTGASLEEAGSYDAALAVLIGARNGGLQSALEVASKKHLATRRTEANDWMIVTPAADDPNADAFGPRVAVRTREAYGDHWVVLVDVPDVASPALVVASTLAERLGAGAIIVRSRLAQIRQSDDAFIERAAGALSLSQALLVSVSEQAAAPTLNVPGRVPTDLNPSAIERRLGIELQTEFRAAAESSALLDTAVRLVLPVSIAERVAANYLGSEPTERWQAKTRRELEDQLRQLVGTEPGAFSQPSYPEIRLYGALVERRVRAAGRAPNAWESALAAALGLRFAEVDAAGFSGWALYEPVTPERRGAATWLARRREPEAPVGAMVFVSAPRWELGTLATGTALALAGRADALLVHGVLATSAADGSSDARQVQGRASFFQRSYETWVNLGGRGVSIRGMGAEYDVSTPVVLTFDAELLDLEHAPLWSRDFSDVFSLQQLGLAPFDGTVERSAFSASADPAVAFGRRFAPDSTFVLWLRDDLRQQLARTFTRRSHQARLGRLTRQPFELELSDFVLKRRACLTAGASEEECQPLRPQPECQADDALKLSVRYHKTSNPYLLSELSRAAEPCGLAVVKPPSGDLMWLAFASFEQRGEREDHLFPLAQTLWSYEPAAIEMAELAALTHLPLRPLVVRGP